MLHHFVWFFYCCSRFICLYYLLLLLIGVSLISIICSLICADLLQFQMFVCMVVSMYRCSGGGANITIKSAIRILLRILNNVIYICMWFCICRWCLPSTGVKRESKARTHYLYNVYSNTFYTVIKECRCISFRQKD